ncbi:MAG: hypothetical protein WBI14_00725, partial [Anaerolineaceae bacterium]
MRRIPSIIVASVFILNQFLYTSPNQLSPQSNRNSADPQYTDPIDPPLGDSDSLPLEIPESISAPLYEPPSDTYGTKHIPTLKVRVNPSIYIPGKPLSISWELKGAENLLLDGSEQVNFYFPELLKVIETDNLSFDTYDQASSLKVVNSQGTFMVSVDQLNINSQVSINFEVKLINREGILDTVG